MTWNLVNPARISCWSPAALRCHHSWTHCRSLAETQAWRLMRYWFKRYRVNPEIDRPTYKKLYIILLQIQLAIILPSFIKTVKNLNMLERIKNKFLFMAHGKWRLDHQTCGIFVPHYATHRASNVDRWLSRLCSAFKLVWHCIRNRDTIL